MTPSNWLPIYHYGHYSISYKFFTFYRILLMRSYFYYNKFVFLRIRIYWSPKIPAFLFIPRDLSITFTCNLPFTKHPTLLYSLSFQSMLLFIKNRLEFLTCFLLPLFNEISLLSTHLGFVANFITLVRDYINTKFSSMSSQCTFPVLNSFVQAWILLLHGISFVFIIFLVLFGRIHLFLIDSILVTYIEFIRRRSFLSENFI